MPMSFDPFSDLDRLTGALLGGRPGPRFMPVDLYREGDTYVLNADLPGIDPGSVDVDVDGQLLTIRAERTAASAEGAKWLSQERQHGSFLRQFTLGEGVDATSISAHYDNGVLSVLLPRGEKAKPRKIEVESANSNSRSQHPISA
jgi:HSP20 family protein